MQLEKCVNKWECDWEIHSIKTTLWIWNLWTRAKIIVIEIPDVEKVVQNVNSVNKFCWFLVMCYETAALKFSQCMTEICTKWKHQIQLCCSVFLTTIHYSIIAHHCVSWNIYNDITSILHYHVPQILVVFLTHIWLPSQAHNTQPASSIPTKNSPEILLWKNLVQSPACLSESCSGCIVSLLQSRDQLQTQQKVSEKGPQSSVNLWGEMTEGNCEWSPSYQKSKKRQMKGLERNENRGTDGE